MNLTFSTVKPAYAHMFTPDKAYTIINLHKIYGYQVITDNQKHVWVNSLLSEYGDKTVKED